MMRLPTRQELVRYSRDRRFLLRSSLILVAISTGLAFLVSLITPAGNSRHYEMVAAGLTPEGKSELISLIRFGLPLETWSRSGTCAQLPEAGDENLFAGSIEAALTKEPDELIETWWKGLSGGSKTEAIARLESAEATLRYRNEFLADLKMTSSDASGALRHYLAEAALFDDASYARRSALFLARFEEDKTLVRKLLGDPAMRHAFAPPDLIRYHAYAGDYAGLARAVLLSETRMLGTVFVLPALFTAAIWFFILLAFRERSSKSVTKALVAFALGIVSAALTLYTVALQQHLHGQEFNAQDSPLAQFVYFLSGVALREEVLKLLCFLPLALAIRKEGKPIEALILAGMVGLGFAFQENLIYFQAGSGTFTAWLRLLTANALHFSLTGVAGFYLWQMLHRRFRGWEEFLVSFIAVVFAHALYNALLAMPSMSDYAPLSPFLIAIIAYQYFDPVRQHMETAGQHRRLSPLGIFILGSVVLTCTILVSSAMVEPFRFALGAFASSVAAMIPLAFAFISRFRDL
jgi:RsiW-degrading membrane proteinase PrsW (M82 family)